jgi:hypothetical protein
MNGVGTLNRRLSIQRQGNQVAISWQGTGFILQAADATDGPWSDFVTGSSLDGVNFGVTVQPSAGMKLFRLRLGRACPAATCAQFIQMSAVYQRVTDNLQVGTEIIPSTGFSRVNIARDRRIILAVTAADNESGVESITYDGELTWGCMTPGDPVATRRVGTLFSFSDEARAGTSAPGHPIIRTEHFTIDPFENRPDRRLCGRTEDQSPVVVTIVINVKNGSNCVTRSGQITFSYLADPAD